MRFSLMLLNKGELGGAHSSARTVEAITGNGPMPAEGPRSMGWGLANVNVLLAPGRSQPRSRRYGWDGARRDDFGRPRRAGHHPDDPELACKP
jgi:hypothetical protein